MRRWINTKSLRHFERQDKRTQTHIFRNLLSNQKAFVTIRITYFSFQTATKGELVGPGFKSEKSKVFLLLKIYFRHLNWLCSRFHYFVTESQFYFLLIINFLVCFCQAAKLNLVQKWYFENSSQFLMENFKTKFHSVFAHVLNQHMCAGAPKVHWTICICISRAIANWFRLKMIIM